jgi:hypothetical protein
MWYPNRKEKKFETPKRNEKVKVEKKILSLEEKNKVKKDFFDKYIVTCELKKHMTGINSAQLSRFYSLLEKRNFYKDSKDIEKFIDGQLDRAKVLGDKSPVGKAKKFYTYYKDNFLKDEDIKDSEKNKIYLTLLKTYFRYILGVERFDEKLK